MGFIQFKNVTRDYIERFREYATMKVFLENIERMAVAKPQKERGSIKGAVGKIISFDSPFLFKNIS